MLHNQEKCRGKRQATTFSFVERSIGKKYMILKNFECKLKKKRRENYLKEKRLAYVNFRNMKFIKCFF